MYLIFRNLTYQNVDEKSITILHLYIQNPSIIYFYNVKTVLTNIFGFCNLVQKYNGNPVLYSVVEIIKINPQHHNLMYLFMFNEVIIIFFCNHQLLTVLTT